MDKKDNDFIDFGAVLQLLLSKKNVFFITWAVVFVLSLLWIVPQPKYYRSEVSLAPEIVSEDLGGLASVASSFGINLGGGAGVDAIYPLLYPELMASNEFVAGLMKIRVKTLDGNLDTNYYDYLAYHQKKSWHKRLIRSAKKLLPAKPAQIHNVEDLDPFLLSEFDNDIFEIAKKNVKCIVDKKTNVVTISVTAQDRLICATMADSVRQHLQEAITSYKTSKARIDLEHYQNLSETARKEYEEAMTEYSIYCDANQNVVSQRSMSKRDQLKNNMQMKNTTYQTMLTQLEAAKARLQERTPSFTILKSATTPIKPAGPKVLIFVLGMLFMSTFVLIVIFVPKMN